MKLLRTAAVLELLDVLFLGCSMPGHHGVALLPMDVQRALEAFGNASPSADSAFLLKLAEFLAQQTTYALKLSPAHGDVVRLPPASFYLTKPFLKRHFPYFAPISRATREAALSKEAKKAVLLDLMVNPAWSMLDRNVIHTTASFDEYFWTDEGRGGARLRSATFLLSRGLPDPFATPEDWFLRHALSGITLRIQSDRYNDFFQAILKHLDAFPLLQVTYLRYLSEMRCAEHP
jgi:hypothetical protein